MDKNAVAIWFELLVYPSGLATDPLQGYHSADCDILALGLVAGFGVMRREVTLYIAPLCPTMEAAEHACVSPTKMTSAIGTLHTRGGHSKKGVADYSNVTTKHAAVVTIKRSMRTPPNHAVLRAPLSIKPQRFKFVEFSGPLFAKHLYPVSFSSPGASIYGMKKNEGHF